MKTRFIWISLFLPFTITVQNAWSSEGASPADTASTQPAGNVKYKAGKEVDFEELLIQGRLKRPDITVVTGEVDGADSLIRLRDQFTDRMAMDMGEEVK